MKTFLENKNHAFTIAKIAIVFQTCVTIGISISLIGILSGSTTLTTFLGLLLLLDVAFVIMHLSYRALYTGPKVELTKTEKKLITLHAGSSLTALLLTFILLLVQEEVNRVYTYLTLGMWAVSLISGIQFFIKKYIAKRHF